MAGKNQYTAKQFIDAIPGSGGIITTIAKRVGCYWHTAKKYIYSHPTILKAYEDECESVLDMAEGVVLGNIKLAHKDMEEGRSADSSDAKWYVTRKGKSRGYTERREITGAEGGPLETKDVTYNDQQRSAILTALLNRAGERTPGSDPNE